VASEPSLDRRSKRLLILVVARFGRPGSASARRALAAEAGLPKAQVRAIRDGDLGAPVFVESERALLALARRFLEAPRVGSRFYDEAERYYTTRRLFEAVLTLGVYQSLVCLPGDGSAPALAPALPH